MNETVGFELYDGVKVHGIILDMLENGYVFPVELIARNEIGFKNLDTLIDLSVMDNLVEYSKEVVTRTQLVDYSEGLLIGTCINDGELTLSEDLTDSQVQEMMMFFDFLEVRPLKSSDNSFEVSRLIKLANELHKIVIVTGDIHDKDFKTIDKSRKEFEFLNDDVLIEKILVKNVQTLEMLTRQ